MYGILIILLLASAVGYVQADISGRLPVTGDFHGMYIDYTISGVSLDSSNDEYGDGVPPQGIDKAVPSLQRKLTGKITGKTVTFSGTRHGVHNFGLLEGGNAYIYYKKASPPCNGVCSFYPPNAYEEFKEPPKGAWSHPFTLTVNVPNDAETIEIASGCSKNADPGERIKGYYDTEFVVGLSGTFANPSSVPNVKPSSASPSSEPGIPWVLIVGPLAIAAIAAIAISKGMGKKKPEEKKEKKEGPTQYILQISPTDTINVSTKEGGSFTATAWKVDETGVPSPADNASITIVPPPGIPGLSVVPVSGMGSVSVSVSIEKPASVNSAKIQVNASMGGGGTTAFVTVNFEATMQVGFE